MDTLKAFVQSFTNYNYLNLNDLREREQESLLPTQQPRHQPVQPPTLPLILTHQLYLDVRRKNDTPVSYLDFIGKTYYQHFKDSFSRSWVCTKSSFYFVIQAFFPNLFQHRAQDLIINLSDTILDEYSSSFEAQAQVQTQAQVQVKNCTRKFYQKTQLKN